MIDTKKMHFRQEGELAFPVGEKDTSSDSSTEETTTEEGTAAAEADKPLPFNEDPKVQEYIERQVSKRVEGIEEKLSVKFGGDITRIKEEFGKKREENAEATKIPKWFGGDQAQWDDYREWMDSQLKSAEERAITGTMERTKQTTDEKQKAVEAATEFFNTELKAIQSDKKLNPTGKAIDPNALLKAAVDNDLVDSKGRWNYRAAMRFMGTHTAASHAPNKEKRELAAATMEGAGGGGGEQKPKNFKTASDFKKKRPW